MKRLFELSSESWSLSGYRTQTVKSVTSDTSVVSLRDGLAERRGKIFLMRKCDHLWFCYGANRLKPES